MKIAVVNNSGNVGKSTICENLLKPRIKDAEIIRVETVNSDGTDDEKFSAREYSSIIREMEINENSILDIGSSNIELFIEQMRSYKDSHEYIDYFLIPITPRTKQQIDSVSTVSVLIDLGIEPSRLRFVFNQADNRIPISRQFSTLINGLKSFDIPLNDVYPTIFETEAFSLLAGLGKTFQEVTDDKSDFKQLIREAETREEKMQLIDLRTMKQLVTGFNDILDAAFLSLNLRVN